METSAPVLHDAILLGVGIAAVYLVVGVLQLLQLKHLRAKPPRPTCEPSLGIVSADESTAQNFATRLQQSQSETLFKHLSDEVERLAAEMHALRAEMQKREKRDASPVHVITHDKPQAASKYNEAMRYAKHGMSAVGVAQKCGISLREAELVVALGRDMPIGRAHDEAHGRQRAA